MMLKNDIANLALGHLGISSTVSDFETENTVQAQILRRYFRISMDYLLEYHDWIFATRVAKLVLHTEEIEFGWRYAYRMPINSLVVREVAPAGRFYPHVEVYPEQVFKFVERVYSGMTLLLSNQKDAHAKYTERLDTNATFPGAFGRALAGRLALDMGPALITNNWPKVVNSLAALANQEISAGIAEDIARNPQKENYVSPLISARWQ